MIRKNQKVALIPAHPQPLASSSPKTARRLEAPDGSAFWAKVSSLRAGS